MELGAGLYDSTPAWVLETAMCLRQRGVKGGGEEAGRWHEMLGRGRSREEKLAEVMERKQEEDGSISATRAPFIVFPLLLHMP